MHIYLHKRSEHQFRAPRAPPFWLQLSSEVSVYAKPVGRFCPLVIRARPTVLASCSANRQPKLDTAAHEESYLYYKLHTPRKNLCVDQLETAKFNHLTTTSDYLPCCVIYWTVLEFLAQDNYLVYFIDYFISLY